MMIVQAFYWDWFTGLGFKGVMRRHGVYCWISFLKRYPPIHSLKGRKCAHRTTITRYIISKRYWNGRNGNAYSYCSHTALNGQTGDHDLDWASLLAMTAFNQA